MHYFPSIYSSPYVSHPFFVDKSVLPVGTKVREMQVGTEKEITDIQSDEISKIRHKECCPIKFWLTMSSKSLPTLAQKAIPQLLVFRGGQ